MCPLTKLELEALNKIKIIHPQKVRDVKRQEFINNINKKIDKLI